MTKMAHGPYKNQDKKCLIRQVRAYKVLETTNQVHKSATAVLSATSLSLLYRTGKGSFQSHKKKNNNIKTTTISKQINELQLPSSDKQSPPTRTGDLTYICGRREQERRKSMGNWNSCMCVYRRHYYCSCNNNE